MKKTLQFLFALMLTATMSAQQVIDDGVLKYTVLDPVNRTCEVSGWVTLPTANVDVNVPGTVDNGSISYTVTSIGLGAFSCNTASNKGSGFTENTFIQNVTLPASVTKFEAHAFRDNSNLLSINLENIVDMGSNCFVQCDGLTGVIDLPACIDLDAYAFFDCDNITGLNIPVVQTIGDGGLYNMDGVREFNVPASVTDVGTLFLGDTGNPNILEQVQLNWDATQLAAVNFENDSKFFRGEWLPNGIEGDDFTDSTVKIYVPENSKSTYEAHPSWGKFPSANIIEGEMPVLSTNNVEQALGLSLFPNPTNGVVSIKSSKNLDNLNVTVFDINGRSLLSTSNARVDISNLAAGLYIFRVKTDRGQLVKRILKQ